MKVPKKEDYGVIPKGYGCQNGVRINTEQLK